MPALHAVFFDMDGLTVTSEELWFETEAEIMSAFGAPWSREQQQAVLGGPLEYTASYMIEAAGASAAVPDVVAMLLDGVERRVRAGQVAWMPGAKELLVGLHGQGVPTALVSASTRQLLGPVLQFLDADFSAAAGATPFRFSVAADDLPRTKPHPDPYLEAAARLGVDPRRCIVLEDSPTGCTAGLAAGCLVIGVPSIRPLTPGPRMLVRTSLTELDAATLEALMNAEVEGAAA